MSHDTTTPPARPTPAFVWGYNNRAGLGLGHTARVLQPTAARLPAGTVDVQGGINFTVALTADGALYAWGGNQYGQLGDGSTAIRREPTPVALPGHAKVSAIAAGTDHVLALTRDRQVLAWGRNHRGQIGNGSTSDQHTPVVVLGPGIASIGAGNAISAAVTDKGGLQAWGRNSFGQLGLPPVLAPRYGTGGLHEVHEHQLRPASVVLPQGGQAALVDAGQRHMIVVTTDGKLVQFGLGAAGAPQAGELALKPSWGRPVQICAGDEFTLIRTSRGLLLSVGGNGDGQLGTGTEQPAVGDSSPGNWQIGLGIAGAVAQGVWAMADLVSDLQQLADPDTGERGSSSSLIDIFDAICPVAESIFLWPSKDPDGPPFNGGIADNTTDWELLPFAIYSALIPTIMIILTRAGWTNLINKTGFPDNVQDGLKDYMAPVVQMISGIANTVLSLTYEIENGNSGSAIAASVLGNLSFIFAFANAKWMEATTDDVPA